MFGVVRSYGRLEPGTIVSCQGISAPAPPDGTYRLDGLRSGDTEAMVKYFYFWKGILVEEDLYFRVTLKPGANQQDFLVY